MVDVSCYSPTVNLSWDFYFVDDTVDLDVGRRWESRMQLHEFSDVVSDKLFAIGKWRDQGSWVAGMPFTATRMRSVFSNTVLD
jgi:hypothetical protein